MSTDLSLLVKSKMFPEKLTYELLDIVRRDDAVEGLIDHINYKMANNASQIESLERQLSSYNETIEVLRGDLRDATAQLKEVTLKKDINFHSLVAKFQEEHKRPPSLDEVWEAILEKL